MLETRWSFTAPETRSRMENWPTLLFSWWCTSFAAVIILTRLCGRKIRSNVLFREDWIMMASLVPLFVRMILIHIVLIYGTNNIQTVGVALTEKQIYQHSVGARLVLGARIFYAMFIWASKLTVSEFLKRITIRIWRKSYEWTLHGIRIFLFLTFCAVVIATLGGCHPFDHYWQVVPSPAPKCRQGYAHLLTMGTCDIITDILLIAFPIPIVMRSGQNWKRKLQLASLFSLSVIMIAVTATRMPKVISHLGRQQYRTVWASCEILASTAVSNAVILGSFLRDKGTKKNKFRSQSVTDSIDRAPTRRPTMITLNSAGSDEDLFRFLGCRVPEHLQDQEDNTPRPAPKAEPANGVIRMEKLEKELHEPSSSDSDDSLRKPPVPEQRRSSLAPSPKQSASFFDVGGLLEDGEQSQRSRSRSTTVVDSGDPGTIALDFAPPSPEQSRRGSHALLSDVGGLLAPARNGNGNSNGAGRRHSDAQSSVARYRNAPTGVLGPMLERQETQESLQDPGGLLPHQEYSEREHTARLIAALRRGPPPGVATVDPSPEPRRPATQQSLQDVGGLLDDEQPAGARRRVGEKASPSPARRVPASPARRRGPDDMELHDPGGLLG